MQTLVLGALGSTLVSFACGAGVPVSDWPEYLLYVTHTAAKTSLHLSLAKSPDGLMPM